MVKPGNPGNTINTEITINKCFHEFLWTIRICWYGKRSSVQLFVVL